MGWNRPSSLTDVMTMTDDKNTAAQEPEQEATSEQESAAQPDPATEPQPASEPASTSDQQPVTPSAEIRPELDKLNIGRTSGQRMAEIVAGVRARMYPTPYTRALSSRGGDLIARILQQMSPNTAALNLPAVRTLSLQRRTEEAIERSNSDEKLYLDLAAGFTPRGIDMLQNDPSLRLIEIDLPDVTKEKQQRLKRLITPEMKERVEFIASDLGYSSLSELLNERQVEVTTAEGLMMYLTDEQVRRLLAQVLVMLKPGGTFVADFAEDADSGLDRVRNVFNQMLRFAQLRQGDLPQFGQYTHEQLEALMLETGFVEVKLLTLSEMAEHYDLPRPVADSVILVEGRKPTS